MTFAYVAVQHIAAAAGRVSAALPMSGRYSTERASPCADAPRQQT